MVRPSAVIPTRCRPWPTGSSPRSTLARQRPSSMCVRSFASGRGTVQPGYHRVAAWTRRSRTAPRRARRLVDSATQSMRPGGCRWRRRRTRRRRSATSPWSATAGPGKTTLAEALLFAAGAIPRLGRVEDGNTVTDFDPEEARRRISVSLGDRAVRARGPQGQRDRHARLRRLRQRRRRRAARRRPRDLRGVGGRGRRGADRGRRGAWPSELGLPRAIFVNKLDRERASFSRTLDQLKDKFGAGVAPLELPIGEEADVPRRRRPPRRHRGHLLDGIDGTGDDRADPDGDGDRGALASTTRSSRASSSPTTTSWSATSPTRRSPSSELEHALANGVATASGVPGAVRERDQAHRRRPARALHRRGGPAHPTVGDGPPVAFVFKTIVDPYVGRVNLFKVLQGTVKTDATLVNGRTDAPTSGCTSSR